MFRVLSIVLTLGALVATFAFANSFTVNQTDQAQMDDQDISSGGALVNSCNHNVGVDLVGNGYSNAQGDFVLNYVLIRANGDCVGDEVTVQLTGANGNAIYTASSAELAANNGGAEASVPFLNQDIPVEEILDVHVMIDAEADWAPANP